MTKEEIRTLVITTVRSPMAPDKVTTELLEKHSISRRDSWRVIQSIIDEGTLIFNAAMDLEPKDYVHLCPASVEIK